MENCKIKGNNVKPFYFYFLDDIYTYLTLKGLDFEKVSFNEREKDILNLIKEIKEDRKTSLVPLLTAIKRIVEIYYGN